MNRSNIRLLKGAALGLGLAFMAALTAFAISCSPGLGTSLDLSGPTLEITSHNNLDYVGKELRLSGSCTDNEKVTRVVAQNITTGETYPDATVTGETWSINLNLPEGEETLKVTAYDKNSNASISSVKQITLLVDATNPCMKSLEILRMPGITTSLKERSVLEALVADDSTNIDSFQNGTFVIRGAAADNYSLNSVVLNLYDENGALVLTKSMPAGSNMTTPSFAITHADLVAANSAYASGRHYLRATVTNTDIGGNTNTDQFLWFCWYPEADVARIRQSMTNNGLLVIPKDTAVPVEYFDDDALSEVYVKMLKAADWASVPGTSDAARLQTLIDDASARTTFLGANALSQAQRIWEYTLPVTWTIGDYELVTLVKDSKADGSAAVWSSRKITVKVTDQDSPITIILSPTVNTFPLLSGGSTFNISGYCLDNSRTEDMKIAWIPNGLTGTEDTNVKAAETLLQDSVLTPGTSATDSSGIKVWSVNLSATPGSRVLNGKPYQERTFAVPMDIFTTFVYNGERENKLKLFVIMTVDNDGNRVFQTFRLLGDMTAPVVHVVSPPSEMHVYSLDKDLSLEFWAEKANGLEIESYTLNDITDAAHPLALTLTPLGALRSAMIDKTTLSGYGECRRTYQFIAKDKLGNESKEQRTIILSNLPVLQYISSGEMDKTYKAGDKITVQAVFSKPVKVTGSPWLDVRYSAVDMVAKHALYSQGSGTDTLVFEYTVLANAVSADLCCDATPINLNGGAITTMEGTGGDAMIAGINGMAVLDAANLLQTRKNIALEGTIPSINTITITGGKVVGGKQYFKRGDLMTITLGANEALSVSGGPKLTLNNGIGGTFYKTNGSNIVFTHIVGKDEANHDKEENVSSVTWTPASAFSTADLALITDLAGNAINAVGGTLDPNAVLDTTTPATPTVVSPAATSAPDVTLYKDEQTIELGGALEDNAEVKYSTDGGLSWLSYDKDNKPKVSSGPYSITAMQIDAAGNQSGIATPVKVEINGVFPEILSTSCEQPTGDYGTGSELVFKLSFAAKVKTLPGCAATITLSGSGQEVTANIQEETTGATVLLFKYTVEAGKTLHAVSVSKVSLTGITDMYGNPVRAAYTVPGYTPPAMVGKTINIDSVAPALVTSACSPTQGKTATDYDATTKETKSIELTFSEDVSVNSGSIIVEPNGAWAIPPVMEETDFSALYYSSALTKTNRDSLMIGDDGAPVPTDSTSDPSVDYTPGGPYRKTTQGVKATTDDHYIPNTVTRYVLRYDLNPKAVGGEVAAIRATMKKAGFRQQLIDVTAANCVTVSGNKVKITFPTPLIVGREWTVFIPAGAFCDSAGNLIAEVSSGTYSFSSYGVATPVIRVKRYSYGDIPMNSTVPPQIVTPPQTFVVDTPTGQTKVRVDCETSGVTIDAYQLALDPAYATKPSGQTTETPYTPPSTASIPDIAVDNLDPAHVPVGSDPVPSLVTANEAVEWSAVGKAITQSNKDCTEFCAEKIYFFAVAKLTDDGDTVVSGIGREAAFKTLIVHFEPRYKTNNHVIQGSTIRGGMPTISGFPLRDAHSDPRYSKYCFKDPTAYDYYWYSWEIVCDFYTQGKYNYPGGNFQLGYDLIKAGCAIGTNQRAYWPGNDSGK